MFIWNGLCHRFGMKEEEVNFLQMRYGFILHKGEDGELHMIFRSRHMADRFAQEQLSLDNKDYGVSQVFGENPSKTNYLGYQINIMYFPRPMIYRKGEDA